MVAPTQLFQRENAVFIRRLIDEVPQLHFLRLRTGGAVRDSVLALDVSPPDAAPAPSVSAVGITGRLTGGRATLLVADDIEVPQNSFTEGMRERLAELVKEFDAFIVSGGEIIYLRPPQTEQSIYNAVRKRGQDCRIWPARFPTTDKLIKYDGAIAEDIIVDIKAGAREDTSTDTERFTDLDLSEREGSYGRSVFALQFMLDTSLSDMERYPLKQSDLIYFDSAAGDAPIHLTWTSDPHRRRRRLNVGFAGDRLYRPMHVADDREKYAGAVMVIDPAGRGKDQTAVCVVKALMGQLYLTALKGLKGGYEAEAVGAIADLAKTQQVKHILIESNFGDGMFQKMLEPYMAKTHPRTIDEYRSSEQKELRIIEDLEPVLNQQRLAIDSEAVLEEVRVAERDPKYSLL